MLQPLYCWGCWDSNKWKSLSTVTQPSESEEVKPSDSKSYYFSKAECSTSSPNPWRLRKRMIVPQDMQGSVCVCGGGGGGVTKRENAYQRMKGTCLSAMSDVSTALGAPIHSQGLSTCLIICWLTPPFQGQMAHIFPSQTSQCLTHQRLTLVVQRPHWQLGPHSWSCGTEKDSNFLFISLLRDKSAKPGVGLGGRYEEGAHSNQCTFGFSALRERHNRPWVCYHHWCPKAINMTFGWWFLPTAKQDTVGCSGRGRLLQSMGSWSARYGASH